MNANKDPAERREHQFPLGSLVKVKVDLTQRNTDDNIKINLVGDCQLYIVGHLFDSSGEPFYMVSDLPVAYPVDEDSQSWSRLTFSSMATVLEYFFEDEVELLDKKPRTLCPTLHNWLEKE